MLQCLTQELAVERQRCDSAHSIRGLFGMYVYAVLGISTYPEQTQNWWWLSGVAVVAGRQEPKVIMARFVRIRATSLMSWKISDTCKVGTFKTPHPWR